MSEKSPEESHVIPFWHRTLSWAVMEVVRVLTVDQTRKLKVRSGEHLAAILVTSVLATAPRSIDSAGEPDLVFDLTNSLPGQGVPPGLGFSQVPFADFEVKSLPGEFREFDAEIDRAVEAGQEPDGRGFKVTVTSANAVLRNEGRDMILKAKRQLDEKSQPGHSKNIFLVAHFFDYPTVEFIGPVMAHLLEPLTDVEGIDSVWVLWAPTHLVVWSVENQQWTDVLFGGANSGDVAPDHDERFDLFQQIELEFLRQTNNPKGSPYVFGLTAGQDGNDYGLGPGHT